MFCIDMPPGPYLANTFCISSQQVHVLCVKILKIEPVNFHAIDEIWLGRNKLKMFVNCIRETLEYWSSVSFIPTKRHHMQCLVSNKGFRPIWSDLIPYGFGWLRFYQLCGLWVFCCVLFIRNQEFERRSPSVSVKQIIRDFSSSCIVISIDNLLV